LNQLNAVDTVLFDLDGTLVDTAPDLAFALNQLRREETRPELPFAIIRPYVSHGSYALIELGFGINRDDPAVLPLRQRLLDIYAMNLLRESRPFPGILESLDRLEAGGYTWGVVTNKPGFLTEPLLQGLGLLTRAACIISGDTLVRRKPDPDPLLKAAEDCGREPGYCVYIGDAQKDVEAARRAGMAALIARFGYIGRDEDPDSWGADGHLQRPLDLFDWLSRRV
jgi:2-phosphoglycolate phosphatase